MKIGCCANMPAKTVNRTEVELIPLLAESGFDYVELSAVYLSGLSSQDLKRTEECLRQCGVSCPNINAFFPPQISLVQILPNATAIREYCLDVFEKASRLGASAIGFGSGASRRVDGPVPTSEEEKVFSEQLFLICSLAAGYGISILLEPLRYEETNYLNHLAETATLISRLGISNLGLLADSYHIRATGDAFDALVPLGSMLRHAHIASQSRRGFPLPSDPDPFSDFLRALLCSGYAGNISVEAFPSDLPADAAASSAFLHQTLIEEVRRV